MNKENIYLSNEKITKLLRKKEFFENITLFLKENGAIVMNEETKSEGTVFLKAIPLLIEKLDSIPSVNIDLENDEIPNINDIAEQVRLSMNLVGYIKFLCDLWLLSKPEASLAILIKSLKPEEQKEYMPQTMENMLEEQFAEFIKKFEK